MKICPKCNKEYPDNDPYCARDECLMAIVKDIQKPESGGTFTYVQGYKYPIKGFPEVVTLGQIATNKRVIISTVKLISKSPFRYILPFLLPFKKKVIKHITYWLSDIYSTDLKKKVIPHKEFSNVSKELLRVLKSSVTEKNEEYRGKIEDCIYLFVMFFEFDFAYRYRLQDLFEALNIEDLNKNPIKEINRIFNLAVTRNRTEQAKKTKTLTDLISITLRVFPSFKNVVVKILNEIAREEIIPDKFDRYHMARYFDYNFEGKTYDERIKPRIEEDKDFVEEIPELASQASISVSPNMHFYSLTEEGAESLANSARIEIMNQFRKYNNL